MLSISNPTMTTVIETCRVSPPAGAGATEELTVPLSFFDMIWIHFHPIRRLLFYNHPCSNSDFLQTIVPKLKQSLSLTLKHYLPVAGNLVYPLNTDEKAVLRYVGGDSVHLTIAESSHDFDELVGNQARCSDQFYDFVPLMPPVIDEPGHKLVPLIAFQITLFPGRGMCLGLANNHALGDGSSIAGFMLAWASINKFAGDDEFLSGNGKPLPIFDRSVLQNTDEISSSFWKVLGKLPIKESSPFPLPTNRVRSTFILTKTDINKLKDLVISNKPDLLYVSSFVVTTSYVWTCLVKSGDEIGEQIGENEHDIHFFPADARGRLNALINPPVPSNYFGNCLGGGFVSLEHKKVVGEEGFVIAAEAVAEEIKNRVNNKDEFLKGAENWLSMTKKFDGIKALGVSGSPKFDLVKADFGWGKARKLEVISMDEETYTMSMCNSRDFEGGLEVGLSLPKERMEAFAACFLDGLK